MKINTRSPLMLGSGSGRGSLIDSDIVFDDKGLPFFPARRLKGLLRESATEVLEMLEQAGLKDFLTLTTEQVLGDPTCPSAIRIHNIYPEDYKETVKCLNYASQEFASIINKEAVMNAVTNIRQQTAINKQGYAKDNSLRTIRVLNPQFCFQGEIEVLRMEWRDELEIWLALACQNLKRAGSGRNRGWGDISCRLFDDAGMDLGPKAIRTLNEWDKNDKRLKRSKKLGKIIPNRPTAELSIVNSAYTHKLAYRITNTSPLLFTAPDGDENMVTSLDYIPGTALHGFFANQLIKQKNYASAYAHKDPSFRQWFLKGALCFSNAYLIYKASDYAEYPLHPTPLSLYTDKQKKAVENLFVTDGEDTKAIGGYCYIKGNELITKNPDKTVNFHLVRNSGSAKARERLEGHGDDGGIFHYQAIKENQNFHGYILGSEESLQAFSDNFSKNSTLAIHIGRSINTQYGRAQITFDKVTVYDTSIDDCPFANEGQEDEKHNLDYNQVVLYLDSPLVLYNSRAYPELSLHELIACLKTRLGVTDIEIKKSFAKVETREAFVSHWKMPEPMFRCWAAGSSFLLQFDQDIDEELENMLNVIMREGLGERRNQGYGQVKFMRQLSCPNQLYNHSDTQTIREKPDSISSLARTILEQVKKDRLERMVIASAAKMAREYYKKSMDNVLLSPSLLGRLETIVRESDCPEDLASKIQQLRDKAKNPLKAMKLWDKSLYDDLTNLQLEKWCQTTTDGAWSHIAKLSQYLGTEMHISSCYDLYWQVFLRTLRKLDKNATGKTGGGQVNAMS